MATLTGVTWSRTDPALAPTSHLAETSASEVQRPDQALLMRHGQRKELGREYALAALSSEVSHLGG